MTTLGLRVPLRPGVVVCAVETPSPVGMGPPSVDRREHAEGIGCFLCLPSLRAELAALPADSVAAWQVIRRVCPILAFASACSCCDGDDGARENMKDALDVIEAFFVARTLPRRPAGKCPECSARTYCDSTDRGCGTDDE